MTILTDRSAELVPLLHTFVAEAMRYDTDSTMRLLKRSDLTMPQVAALYIVERQGTSSISEIGVRLDYSLGNASMLVDKLVCHGYVTRVEDAQDRRHKKVQLTEKGHGIVDELRTARVQGMAERMLLLPPELLDRALHVLREINAQLPPAAADVCPPRATQQPNTAQT